MYDPQTATADAGRVAARVEIHLLRTHDAREPSLSGHDHR